MNTLRLLDKAGEKLQSALLSKTAKAVRREHLTYLSISKLRHLEKTLQDIHHHRVAGDYLEFGIALGGSAILIAKAAKDAERSFTGFDIFGTIPPPSDKDDVKSKERYKTIADGKSQGLGGDPYYG
ncbi:MAG TPA: TylF/MycF/NovP-related O-methyltransferase, partial [Terriglobales bacterium]|nr:TylF/MycF/NovP-related O-methyltransferase [Terriglobales bacterium]